MFDRWRRMSWTIPKHDRLAFLIVLATAVCVFLVGMKAPKHNWDMVAYVASAYAADGYSGRPLQNRTYADVGGAVDASAYRGLTAGPYRGTVARDPVALEQQLPFYTIRVVYIAAVRAVGRTIGSYTRATQLVAASFAFLSVLVMAAVMIRAGVSPVILPAFVLPIGVLDLARLATPDSMACFASLSLVLALRRPGWLAYAIVIVLPAIRSDYVIFSALVATLLFFTHDRLRATIAVLAAVILYLLLARWSGNYGYLNLLNFTLFGQQPFPAHMPLSTDLGAYAKAIAANVDYLISDGIFLLYVFALMLLWHRRGVRDDQTVKLLMLPVLFATAHFALFPSYDKRFLVSSFFLVTVGVLRAITGATHHQQESGSPPPHHVIDELRERPEPRQP